MATLILLLVLFSVAIPVHLQGCPEPHAMYRGSCYYIDRERSYVHSEASQYCEGNQAKLVTILDEDEQAFIAGFLRSGPSTAAWIGLSDAEDEGNFAWNDGTPLTYQNWLEGSPNNYNDADCGIIRSWDSKWNDLNCEKSYGAFCELPVEIVDCGAFADEPGRVVEYNSEPTDGIYPEPSTATFLCEGAMDLFGESEAVCLTTGWTAAPSCVARDPPCPDGWVYYQWSCYHISESVLSGASAVAYCSDLGAHLADIENAAEDTFIIANIQRYGYAYVGLTDHASEGDFVWSDGTPLGYSNWDPELDQPNNFSNSDCVLVRPAGNWNDVPCEEEYHAFCVQPANY